jgi:small subunit ribosomal protein S13
MARIEGTYLPDNKRVEIALTRIYGIGNTASKKILEKTNIDKNKKVKDISDSDLAQIRKELQNHLIEGDLRKKVSLDIKRMVDLGCYRGIRHRRKLPVRGQRSKTNARTSKTRSMAARKY